MSAEPGKSRDEHPPFDPDWDRRSPAEQYSRRLSAVGAIPRHRARVARESAVANRSRNHLRKLRRKQRRVGRQSPEGKALQAQIDRLVPELGACRVRCHHWRRELVAAEALASGLDVPTRDHMENQWKALERVHERRPSAFRTAQRRPAVISAPRRTPRARPVAQRPRVRSSRSTRAGPSSDDDGPSHRPEPSRRTGELRHIQHPLAALLRDLRPADAPPLIPYVRDPQYGLVNLRLAAVLRSLGGRT